MVSIGKLREKSVQYRQALATLQDALAATPANPLEKDGTIQRFEFCFELCWKLVRIVIEYETGTAPYSTPRAAFQEAIRHGIFSSDAPLIEMMEDRNLAAHTYDAAMANALYKKLPLHLQTLLILSNFCAKYL